MEHVVFFTGPDKSAQFRRTPSLDEAVRFVESLRNGEGIDDSKVYALSEVPLRFQTYYRVEVPADAAGSPAPAAAPAAPPAPPEPTASAPEPTAFAPVEPVFAQPSAGPTFEPVAVGAESSSAPAAAEVPVETLPAAPAVETLEAPNEAGVPDLLNGGVDDDSVEAGANGKPHRGLGFFAR